MPRYFEIIITGRQLASLITAVALLVAVAFVLGVGVRGLQPRPVPPPALLVGEAPTAIPEATPVPLPATPVPAVRPTATAAPTPTHAAPPATVRPAAIAPAPRAAGRWVQVAALARHEQAEGVRTRIVAFGYTQRQVVVQAAEGKYRIRVGPFPDVESAGRVAARLRAEGFKDAFVVSE